MTGIGAITADGAISTTSTLNADGAVTLAGTTIDANADLTLASGTGSFIVTNSVTNASDQVIDIAPSFAGGATDLLTYTVIDVAAFTPTNALGTDTIEGLAIRALTQGADAARLTANAITIGDGWDLGITGATYTIEGTTALTIGAGGGTIALNSSDWDISTTGVATGFGAITSDGTITSGGTFTGSGATTYDAGGAAAITIGSADVLSLTVTTDSTGDAEVVLPAGSISGAEILDTTILTGDIGTDTILAGNIATNAIGALELATDAVAAATDIATTLCTGSQILKKNAGNTAWECAADGGGGSTTWDTIGDAAAAGEVLM
jgi:hypothetical protein